MTPPTSADAPLGKLLTMSESQLEKNIAHGETLKTAPSVAIEDLARELRFQRRRVAELEAENARLKANAIEDVLGHWLIQGGQQQFGAIEASNADELVSAILRVVRARLVTLEAERDALQSDLRTNAAMLARQCDLARDAELATMKAEAALATARAERDALRQALTHGGTVDAADR